MSREISQTQEVKCCLIHWNTACKTPQTHRNREETEAGAGVEAGRCSLMCMAVLCRVNFFWTSPVQRRAQS